jgi:nucleoside-diphosphate-sugar epimerase
LRKQDWQVTGWVRSEESARALQAEGFGLHWGDVANPSDWTLETESYTHVVHCASSSRSGPEVYDQVYRLGMEQVRTFLPRARKIFVSSTSVYGQNDAHWVDETSPAEPIVETGKILRTTENETLAKGGIVARVGGIYGPERGVLLKKFLAGEAVIEGDGTRWINQIHRDDIVSALHHLLVHAGDSEIYNVTDNAPSTYEELYGWLAEKLQCSPPPRGPVQPGRKRGLTNKRVRNEKLRRLGWSPQFPSFREGYTSLLGAVSK